MHLSSASSSDRLTLVHSPSRSRSSQEPPQTAIAIQCDGHPDIVLREHPTGNVIFKVPNGTNLGVYEDQGEYVRVVVIADPAIHGWTKRSNLQLNIRRAITCQREGHPDVVVRVSPAGPLKCKVPNGTVCGILKDSEDDIQVWIESDAATIGWIKRWNLQIDGIAQPISPLATGDQPSFDDFESPQSLFAYCMWAQVRWLKIRYLLTMERLPRCQDTPNEALATSQELEEWSTPFRSKHFRQRLVSISHPWWAHGEPDPEGHQLASIRGIPGSSGLLYHAAREQPDAVFYDYVCLPQQPGRSAEQNMYFKRALEYMHLLYIHSSTWVFLLDGRIPEHAANSTPYMDRGWCVFERKVANLSSGGMASQATNSWVSSFTEPCDTPNEFRAKLELLTFAAAGTDRALVGDLYAKVYSKIQGRQTAD